MFPLDTNSSFISVVETNWTLFLNQSLKELCASFHFILHFVWSNKINKWYSKVWVQNIWLNHESVDLRLKGVDAPSKNLKALVMLPLNCLVGKARYKFCQSEIGDVHIDASEKWFDSVKFVIHQLLAKISLKRNVGAHSVNSAPSNLYCFHRCNHLW